MKDKNAVDTSLKSFAENWRETGLLDAIRGREVAALTQAKRVNKLWRCFHRGGLGSIKQ